MKKGTPSRLLPKPPLRGTSEQHKAGVPFWGTGLRCFAPTRTLRPRFAVSVEAVNVDACASVGLSTPILLYWRFEGKTPTWYNPSGSPTRPRVNRDDARSSSHTPLSPCGRGVGGEGWKYQEPREPQDPRRLSSSRYPLPRGPRDSFFRFVGLGWCVQGNLLSAALPLRERAG